jgi:acetyl esterase/lipase
MFDAKLTPPTGVRSVVYSSGDYALAAWFAMPTEAQQPVPAILYLHGGFSFGAEDYEAAKPFADAGFALMMPMLRGENGNPGDFELWYGELDDAVAALRWLARQPGIDPKRIFAFGHSVGGGLAALLSLVDIDVPLADTASSGGLYPYDIFKDWHDIVPFQTRNPHERQLRILLGNTWWMKRPHHAYLGNDDPLHRAVQLAENEAAASSAPLTIESLPGDAVTSLPTAIRRYINRIKK